MQEQLLFLKGRTYNRRDLHQRYGGQAQGGISTPVQHPFIMLFTGEQGEQYGYRDGWTADGVFLYTGEGQLLDMNFVRGNRAIRDHSAEGKDLHLFEYVASGQVRYVGQMVFTGFHLREAPDREKSLRTVIVFELAPVEGFLSKDNEDGPTEDDLWDHSLPALREKALQLPPEGKDPAERRALAWFRSAAVRTYVLKRSRGQCESCGNPAPFVTNAGRPYLEPHHIRRLSDGGPDHPSWVAALCPNCHRRAHYANDAQSFNQGISRKVHEIEKREAGA